MNDDLDSGQDVPSAAQVRAARGLLGWSQQKLAEASGVVRRTVTTIEQGGAASEASAMAIAKALREAGIDFTGDVDSPGVTLRSRN